MVELIRRADSLQQNDSRKNEFYVYVYLNPLNENKPFYVGRGKGDRVFHHLRPSSLSRHSYKNHTINMILRETGIVPPIAFYAENLTFEESCRIEMELISKYGRADLGNGTLTNLTDGGDGLSGISDETRLQMSLAKRGTIAVVAPDGRRFRVSGDDPRWLSGELLGLTKGMPCHENTRRVASETHRGKKQSDELVKKRADAMRGRKFSADHSMALSKARKGKVMVRSRDGGPSFKVSVDDHRLLSGELVGVTSGRIWVHNPQTRECKVVDPAAVPEGFVKGRIL